MNKNKEVYYHTVEKKIINDGKHHNRRKPLWEPYADCEGTLVDTENLDALRWYEHAQEPEIKMNFAKARIKSCGNKRPRSIKVKIVKNLT